MLVLAWACYAAYVRTMLHLVMFLGRFWVDKHVDAGRLVAAPVAAVADLALLALFAVPHSLMARPRFKAWLLARGFPEPLERSLYVLVASILLWLCLRLWLPIPIPLVVLSNERARTALRGVGIAGWLLGLVAIHTQGHFRLFGVRRAWDNALGRAPRAEPLVTRGVYGLTRHPMYLGFVVGCWATPDLTVGHALFATILTAYAFAGSRLEERDLQDRHGEAWTSYARVVPRLPRPRRRAAQRPR